MKTKKMLIVLLSSIIVSIIIITSVFGCAGDQVLKGYNHAKPTTQSVTPMESEEQSFVKIYTPWVVWVSMIAIGVMFFWRMDRKKVVETNDS